jgi:hypothetical protein
MLRHQAFFWLRNPASEADRDTLIAGLRSLAAIGHIDWMDVGLPAATEARDVVDASWDVVETMHFPDTAAQKLYQDHPLHQAFIASCEHLWAKVLVFDAQIV